MERQIATIPFRKQIRFAKTSESDVVVVVNVAVVFDVTTGAVGPCNGNQEKEDV